MSLLRAALRSNSTVSTLQKGHGLPLVLRESPRLFSTEAEQPPQDSVPDPFLQTSNRGKAYGRLIGIHKHTLKTDIINLLKGCNLTMEDVKVDYNRQFMPLAMMLQFNSHGAHEEAIRMIARNGRLYKLERADRGQWDFVTPYDGKTILIQGIPRNASLDEVERILSGLDYDPSSINLFVRPGDTFANPIRMATVRFRSRTEAMNAFITKNRAFCLNNQISIQVLQ